VTSSAVLNPYKEAFCLNSSVTQLEIPLLINQTEPIEIELLRIDIETNQNETILMKRAEVKSLLKKARKGVKHANPEDPLVVRPIVKKPGVYVLKKVLDHSKLEVRPRASNAVVVACPQARVKPTAQNRCRHDLSDITLEVEGVPPLRIKYRTNVGGHPREASELQSLLPDGYSSPLSRHTSQALIRTAREDVSWAQSQKVSVALNETLTHSGVWSYAVEEVSDGLGNIVNYVSFDDDDRPKPKTTALQTLSVHERPNIKLQGCDTQHPLQTAKGTVVRLPILYGSTGRSGIDTPHTIEYLFTPEADLSLNGDHSPAAELKKQVMKTSREQPLISASGLYTLTSVSTEFCGGEVLEPASCLLQNPLEPELSISSEDIVDKCAGNPIGFRVTLDFVGSPPFHIKYREQKAGRRQDQPKRVKIDSLRSTIELTPKDAGHYTYTFDSISDWIYPERPLHNMVLVQDVKPSASAHFVEAAGTKQACIDDTVEFDVGLTGEGPFTLDFEIIHNGKRTKRSVEVEEHHYTIKTEKLSTGGEYTVSLISVKDKMGCKEFLKQAEAKVNVRHERPKAYFGHIDGKQNVMALEGKAVDLPLRLTGSKPWRLEYENLDTKEIKKVTINEPNYKLNTQRDGTYQLLSVRDSVCPGFIDEKASQFSVGWVARPKITVPESASTIFEGGKYIREAVCEGDEDAFDISLSGKYSRASFLYPRLTMHQDIHLLMSFTSNIPAPRRMANQAGKINSKHLLGQPLSAQRLRTLAPMNTNLSNSPTANTTFLPGTSLLSPCSRRSILARTLASTSLERRTATVHANLMARKLSP
jgi:nucleoporin POM152